MSAPAVPPSGTAEEEKTSTTTVDKKANELNDATNAAVKNAEAKAKANAEAKAIANAEAKAIANAEAKAKANALAKEKANAEAKEKANAEAKEKAKANADAKAKANAATESRASTVAAPPAPVVAPVVAAPVVAAPIVAAAANAVTNAKNEEICFIYSNAYTKGTFKKGCIVVYKGNKTASDRSADMLQQLLAQKDLQVVKGGVQTSFVQSINDKTSLFIAYVEVMNTPTDEQIKEMKDSISKAISKPSPTKGGKRFHTKKRHAKKKTTRRRS